MGVVLTFSACGGIAVGLGEGSKKSTDLRVLTFELSYTSD